MILVKKDKRKIRSHNKFKNKTNKKKFKRIFNDLFEQSPAGGLHDARRVDGGQV